MELCSFLKEIVSQSLEECETAALVKLSLEHLLDCEESQSFTFCVLGEVELKQSLFYHTFQWHLEDKLSLA